ncbi:Ig-like domain-containing protein [Priestia sp. 40]|uniref:Ig-like domain-containing protein n=1 Tax=Priestia sp. 40 TaxID=3394459 RepID=UPI003BF6823D
MNDPPITADLAFTINEDTPLTNQIPAFDPDGDPLTFTLLNPPPSNGSVVFRGKRSIYLYTKFKLRDRFPYWSRTVKEELLFLL